MDFRLTEEQKLIAATARQVGERFGTDYWRKQDEAKAFPAEFWRAVCDAGLAVRTAVLVAPRRVEVIARLLVDFGGAKRVAAQEELHRRLVLPVLLVE